MVDFSILATNAYFLAAGTDFGHDRYLAILGFAVFASMRLIIYLGTRYGSRPRGGAALGRVQAFTAGSWFFFAIGIYGLIRMI